MNGEFIVGKSSLYTDPLRGIPQDSALVGRVHCCEVQKHRLGGELDLWRLSSLVWVCSSNEKRSYVTILDANNANCILECFSVCASHLLCISSVPGMSSTEVHLRPGVRETSANAVENFVCDGGYLDDLPSDVGATETFGQVHCVQCKPAEGESAVSPGADTSSPKRARDCRCTVVRRRPLLQSASARPRRTRPSPSPSLQVSPPSAPAPSLCACDC